MKTPHRLERFLKKHHVSYEIVNHPQAFTSSATAEAEHISGNEVAKVVMVKARKQDVMAVLPASCCVDWLKMSTVLGTQDVSLEKEVEFAALFPDCEPGAMPPFGKLYKVPCYVDKNLKNADWITFNAGSHTESIRMPAKDFFRIVKAEIADFAVPAGKAAV
jgi:Ala-tRNA(Pro) deacylase